MADLAPLLERITTLLKNRSADPGKPLVTEMEDTLTDGYARALELEVLKLIANGKDNAQIARDLFISPKTVKNHISNILMKLQIENRIQAAVYAVRSGIV